MKASDLCSQSAGAGRELCGPGTMGASMLWAHSEVSETQGEGLRGLQGEQEGAWGRVCLVSNCALLTPTPEVLRESGSS